MLGWLTKLFRHGGTTSVSSVTVAPIPAARPPCRAKIEIVRPPMKLDPRTAANIATLHPRAQAKAREFMVLATEIAAKHNLVVKIISGLRSYAEQDALYAKGRTAPGPKVSNARAGYSNHNFGTAWDIGLFKGTKYITEHPAYREIGAAGKSLGLTWGGNFRSIVDEPHFELPTGLTLAQMRQRVRAGTDLFA